MITEEKKHLYLRDKIINIILTSKDTRCYVEAIIASSLGIPKDIVKDNLELLSPRINSNINTQYSTVDALYESNQSIINIEINFNNDKRLQNKNMKYICHLLLKQFKINDKDLELKPIYQININNYDIFKENRFIYRSYIMEESLHIKRDDLISVIDINMDFLKKMDYTEIMEEEKNSLERLLYILICDNKEEMDKLYIGDSIMEKVRNKILDLTEEDWQELYYDPEELRRLCIMDEVRNERTLEIAKSMLNDNISEETIMKHTGLTLEEVNALKNK